MLQDLQNVGAATGNLLDACLSSLILFWLFLAAAAQAHPGVPFLYIYFGPLCGQILFDYFNHVIAP